VGRRSRKRSGASLDPAETPSSRAERDAARRERARAKPGSPARSRTATGARPPAPWGSFPLGELVVLLGIVLIVWGAIRWDERGRVMFVAGFTIASLAGLELSVREHFAGFRSHTTLLAAAAGFVATIATFLVAGSSATAGLVVPLVGGLVFALCFYLLRQVFRRRSGGLSFR
jgi:hypothetical protein